MLMAGLDGIKNKIDPGKPLDKNLYELSSEELKGIPTVAENLAEAVKALDEDRKFLTEGNVFSNDQIDGYIELKQEEIWRLNYTTHPVEYDMYYGV